MEVQAGMKTIIAQYSGMEIFVKRILPHIKIFYLIFFTAAQNKKFAAQNQNYQKVHAATFQKC